jgi:hypothetical protein
MTTITNLIDAHIKLAEEQKVTIEYIAMSEDHMKNLTSTILSSAGMDGGDVEFSRDKNYRDIQIRIHSVSQLKVVYSL